MVDYTFNPAQASCTIQQSNFQDFNYFFRCGDPREVYPVFVHPYAHPVYLRRGTSDWPNLIQCFFHKEHDVETSHPVSNILDCGSYVGLSAIFFALKYPQAHIVCLEPSPENFEILKLNTRCLPNVTCINKALWSEETTLQLFYDAKDAWGTRVNESPKNTKSDSLTETVTIAGVMKEFEWSEIDILKIDIEGSEKQVFSENTNNWIGCVKTVMCELHDGFIPGCTEAYVNLFSRSGYRSFTSGEFRCFQRQETTEDNSPPIMGPSPQNLTHRSITIF